mgnify:CR=1 FL=1
MGMNKTIIIGFVLTGLLLILGLVYFVFNNNTVKVGTKSGAQIKVNDFFKQSTKVKDKSVDIMSNFKNGLYTSMSYSQTTSTFTLSFNAVDYSEFQVQRKALEQQFLTILKITEPDACKLKVEERNTPSPDPDINGKVFGLSFCN